MAISDNPNRQGQVSKVRRTQADAAEGVATWWSDKQKLETVQTYLMLGNAAMTARVLKIPEDTVYRWRKSAWWKEIEGELRVQDELQLSARLQKVVAKSMDAVEERLENGDYVYNQKTGEMRRKPVSMRDAHKVSMDLIDKRHLINNRNAPTASEEQMNDKLAKMMIQFANFAKGQLDKNNTIDVQDVTIVEDANENEMVQDNGSSDEVHSDFGQEEVVEMAQKEQPSNP